MADTILRQSVTGRVLDEPPCAVSGDPISTYAYAAARAAHAAAHVAADVAYVFTRDAHDRGEHEEARA